MLIQLAFSKGTEQVEKKETHRKPNSFLMHEFKDDKHRDDEGKPKNKSP